MEMPHKNLDEAVATEAVDVGTVVAENAALRERLLRALADAENTRRRAEREKDEVRRYSIAEFARELLIVADNLQRTLIASKARQVADPALIEGAHATLRVLIQTLERFGVRPIEALDRRFDPNLHEAIMEADDPSRPPGTITQVVEEGYTIGDRLLRPARVVVSKGPINAAPPRESGGTEDEPSAFPFERE
jgi:molecular chaperone GrpE